MLNHVRSWLFVDRLSRPTVVLNGLPGLYGFKYDSATACGLPLYLYSYKLVGSATPMAWLDAASETHVGVGHGAPVVARWRERRGLEQCGAVVPLARCRGTPSRCLAWHRQGPPVGQHRHSRARR